VFLLLVEKLNSNIQYKKGLNFPLNVHDVRAHSPNAILFKGNTHVLTPMCLSHVSCGRLWFISHRVLHYNHANRLRRSLHGVRFTTTYNTTFSFF